MKTKTPIHAVVYQTCCQTVDALRGFVSVYVLKQRAHERYDRVTFMLKRTVTALFRGRLNTPFTEVTISADERHNRGSLYSLHGDDPRAYFSR